MFKKIYFLAFSALMATVANSGPLVYWPGYVDNSECLLKASQGSASECGFSAFSNMNNHGSPTSESREFEFYSEWKRIWQHLNNKEEASRLSYIEVHFKLQINQDDLDKQRFPFTKEDGLPLKTTNGDSTPYLLKGFGAGNAAFKVEYLLCNKKNDSINDARCTVDGSWKTLKEFTFDEIVDYKDQGWGELLTLQAKQAIHGFRVTTGDPRFRLGFRGKADSDVRSLILPGISIIAKITPKNAQGNKVRDTVTDHSIVRRRTQTRLNHRKCYLTTDDQKVPFGQLYVEKNAQGKIGPEVKRILKLRCNAESENLQIGGHVNHVTNAGQFQDITVNGSRVVHTVKNVSITAGSDFIDSSGVKQIGLIKEGATTVSDKLYVEGSLKPSQPCGVSPLTVGNNQVHGTFIDKLKASPIEANDISEHDYSTIYWKLCKNRGSLEAGKYTGNATIRIEYQ